MVCRSLDSRNIVPSCRTGTSSEIRNDNLQVAVRGKAKNVPIEKYSLMKLPVGKISGEELNVLFEESIKHHIDVFYKTISEYEPLELYSNWRTIIRSIDEIINIPMECDDTNFINNFLGLSFNFIESNNFPQLKVILDFLEKNFEKNIAVRFQQLSTMCFAINKSYEKCGVYNLQGSGLNLSTTADSIAFLQSRRAYYVTTLDIITKIAKGKKKVSYLDTLNFLQYTMDSCLIGVTTSYYNLLINHCLDDFEMESDGIIAKRNFDYDHLEGFFMEPERLSLIDQMELRPGVVIPKQMLPKSDNKIFSFSEIANTMSLFEGAFDKYKINDNVEFKELNLLFCDIALYVKDDFNIIIEEADFKRIARKYKSLSLINLSTDYFAALNSYSPFQNINGAYYSTVVLLTRFIYRTLSQSLMKNRTFQIHSGFIFEDKVSKILEKKGFAPTNITRINQKEFDLITIKDDKVYNFQCKNNFIDISRVNFDYKIIGRFNKRLCRYYEKAFDKEVKREKLIKDKTGIDEVEHFVISRYPVINRDNRIINFIDLEKWIPDE